MRQSLTSSTPPARLSSSPASSPQLEVVCVLGLLKAPRMPHPVASAGGPCGEGARQGCARHPERLAHSRVKVCGSDQSRLWGHERRSPWPLATSALRSGSGRPRSHKHPSGGPLGLAVPEVRRQHLKRREENPSRFLPIHGPTDLALANQPLRHASLVLLAQGGRRRASPPASARSVLWREAGGSSRLDRRGSPLAGSACEFRSARPAQ